MSKNIELGRLGESLAADHLINRGYCIVARNWRCREGEIDLIASLNGRVVVVEVKTRSQLAAGHPFEAVDHRKFARLHRLAVRWAHEHGVPFTAIRIDLIGVLLQSGRMPVIEHMEGLC